MTYSLTQSKRARGSAGEPLPAVWAAFQRAGIVFRRGQLALITAAPGTAKSALTLTYALRAAVPALYMSADSDAYEQLVRAVCILTGASVADARRTVLSDDLRAVEPALAASPVRFCYDASPTLDVLNLHVEAYEEVYGEYPHLIVADNLTDIRAELAAEGESRSTNLDALLSYLHELARATGAAVIALHHVTGGYNDGDKPIPLSGIKDQVGRVPEMVLTIHKVMTPGEPDSLRVSPVKIRGGRPDPSGQTFAELEFDGDHMAIRDIAATGPLGWREDVPAPGPAQSAERASTGNRRSAEPEPPAEEAEDIWS